MTKFYIRTIAQGNGDYEVHIADCRYFPRPENRKYLGDFDSCAPAVAAAKKIYTQANGCYYCSSACHSE